MAARDEPAPRDAARGQPLPPRKNPWTRKERHVLYENPWMEIRKDKVIRPDGSFGPYAYVHFKNLAVAVLPLMDDGRVVLVGQWRYTLDAYSWEIPAGGCPHGSGESALETAHRELGEETGMRAREMIALGRGHLSNSITDEETAMFVARGLEPADGFHKDPTEDLELRIVPFDELLGLIQRGEITDGLTLITVLRYQLARSTSSGIEISARGSDIPR